MAISQEAAGGEAMQETLALLTLIAVGRLDIAAGRTAPVKGLADRIHQMG